MKLLLFVQRHPLNFLSLFYTFFDFESLGSEAKRSLLDSLEQKERISLNKYNALCTDNPAGFITFKGKTYVSNSVFLRTSSSSGFVNIFAPIEPSS